MSPSHPHDRKGRKVRKLHFSALEMAAIWSEVMETAGDKGNPEFEKEFRKALRIRSMRKLSMFSGDGFEVPLATGAKYAQETWIGSEAEDGGLILENVE
jgi:hypothetical protein